MMVRRRFDVAAQKSMLTGAEFRRRLHEAGASAADLTALFGLPGPQVHRLLGGDLDGQVPMTFEVALDYVGRHGAELRARLEPLSRGTNRLGYRLSGVTGWELYQRLRAIAWSLTDFARFTGMTDRSIRDLVRGERDGKITLLLEHMVEFAERHPLELQALRRLRTPIRQSPARREAVEFMRARIGDVVPSAWRP